MLFSKCRKDPPIHKSFPGWKVYTAREMGLPYDDITVIVIDRLSNVWLYGGVYLVKYDNSTFRVIPPPASHPTAFICNCGVGKGDYIWFGSSDAGLYKMNIFDNSLQLFTQSNSGLPSNVVFDLAADTASNILWIATSGGLVFFDGNNWQVFDQFNSPMTATESKAITIDAYGSKWFTVKRHPLSPNDTSAYVKFDDQNNAWSLFNTSNSPFPIYGAWDAVVDNDNGVWFSGVGLDRYFQGDWIKYNSTNVPGFPNDQVQWLAKDNKGKIWITTAHNGLMTFYNGQWEHLTTENSGLPTDTISSLAIKQNGEVWIGTIHGVAVFDNH